MVYHPWEKTNSLFGPTRPTRLSPKLGLGALSHSWTG